MSAQAMGLRAIPRTSLSLFGALPPLATLAGVIIFGYVAIAISAPLWVPFDPSAVLVGPPISPPAADHWFGTDSLGRDVFSRVMYGSRPVLIMALSSTTLAVVCGATIGLLAGYKRGWFDQVAMRLTDVLVSFPTLILAMLILSAVGNTALYVVLTVAFINMPRIARVVRAATLTIVAEDYVTAAVTRGESTASIIFIELMPNVSGTIFVEFAVRSGFVIVFIGALGFLGFGAPPPTSEWGVMINEGRTTLMLSVWPVLAPASAMALLVVALNLFTDGIAGRIGAGAQAGPRV